MTGEGFRPAARELLEHYDTSRTARALPEPVFVGGLLSGHTALCFHPFIVFLPLENWDILDALPLYGKISFVD